MAVTVLTSHARGLGPGEAVACTVNLCGLALRRDKVRALRCIR